MTTKVDDYSKRTSIQGIGRENSQGIPRDGFADPTGEYPDRDYYFASSVSKSAMGATVNELYSAGGDIGVATDFADQRPSQYPLNQVQQTPAGHAIEIDDTPGGERILIKHKSGAGIEMRADGSVLMSTANKKVEVVGGDNTVIVEGEANLVYKGNVNLHVTGDYNLTVDGNINVETAGNKIEKIHRNHRKTVDENQNYTIKKHRSARVVGRNEEIILDDSRIKVKGKQENLVEGNVLFSSGNKMLQTAKNEWVTTAPTANLTGVTVSIIGEFGTIGGEMIDHYGKAYSGPPGGSGNGGTTFYGTLVGRAANATVADYSNKAGEASFAQSAPAEAGTADGATKTRNAKTYETTYPFVVVKPFAPMPTNRLLMPHIETSEYAVRNVSIDYADMLKLSILKTDDYDFIMNREPNIHEIRSKLRDENNRKNKKFIGSLIAEGKLSESYAEKRPPAYGRAVGKPPAPRFGYQLLGNNPAENRSKRFKPKV